MILTRGEYRHKVSGNSISVGMIKKHYHNIDGWILVCYDDHISFCSAGTLEQYDKKAMKRAIKPHIKQYRMAIPKPQLKAVGLKNGDQVSIIVGTEQYVEIWNSEKWDKYSKRIPSPLELFESKI